MALHSHSSHIFTVKTWQVCNFCWQFNVDHRTYFPPPTLSTLISLVTSQLVSLIVKYQLVNFIKLIVRQLYFINIILKFVLQYINLLLFKICMVIENIEIGRTFRGCGGRGSGSVKPYHFVENYKELLRKKCFQLLSPPPSPSYFESLVSPTTFKVAPRSMTL